MSKDYKNIAPNLVLLPSSKNLQSQLEDLRFAPPTVLHLRDGEVIVYRRPNTPVWQCRFKRQDSSWHRQTTKQASIEHAVRVACELYDESRFRQRLGLAQKCPDFTEIAHTTLYELRRDLDAGIGKSVYYTYITCIEKYFLPYFQDARLENITHTDVREFEVWRNRQMMKVPKASTLNNFASAWSKIQEIAINKGWVSEKVAIPKLITRGIKSKPRAAFSREEIERLLTYMESWFKEGRLEVEREIRPLVRDYVEMLLLTGMRHGTEALNICWNNIEWHTDKGVKYLRIWVNGKTGGRWLIAKHRAVDVLKRLHIRQKAVYDIPFDRLFETRAPQRIFVLPDGHQPLRIDGTFKKLLRDSGLLKNVDGQARTLQVSYKHPRKFCAQSLSMVGLTL
jgi:integrase